MTFTCDYKCMDSTHLLLCLGVLKQSRKGVVKTATMSWDTSAAFITWLDSLLGFFSSIFLQWILIFIKLPLFQQRVKWVLERLCCTNILSGKTCLFIKRKSMCYSDFYLKPNPWHQGEMHNFLSLHASSPAVYTCMSWCNIGLS